jgi:phenylpyruvate tautomerase PptA (4-oxalocrotonate tautomerase family)
MTLDMPIVTVSMYTERKDRLDETITEDVAKILNIYKKEVIIVFQVCFWYLCLKQG